MWGQNREDFLKGRAAARKKIPRRCIQIELVEEYLEKTNIDAWAITCGTAHGIYKVKSKLNLEVISEIRKRTNIPLVMHGGRGISDEEYRKVIHRGIDKINYYTYMFYAGYAAVKAMAEQNAAGFYHDMAISTKNAMRKNALSTLNVFSEKECVRRIFPLFAVPNVLCFRGKGQGSQSDKAV